MTNPLPKLDNWETTEVKKRGDKKVGFVDLLNHPSDLREKEYRDEIISPSVSENKSQVKKRILDYLKSSQYLYAVSEKVDAEEGYFSDSNIHITSNLSLIARLLTKFPPSNSQNQKKSNFVTVCLDRRHNLLVSFDYFDVECLEYASEIFHRLADFISRYKSATTTHKNNLKKQNFVVNKLKEDLWLNVFLPRISFSLNPTSKVSDIDNLFLNSLSSFYDFGRITTQIVDLANFPSWEKIEEAIVLQSYRLSTPFHYVDDPCLISSRESCGECRNCKQKYSFIQCQNFSDYHLVDYSPQVQQSCQFKLWRNKCFSSFSELRNCFHCCQIEGRRHLKGGLSLDKMVSYFIWSETAEITTLVPECSEQFEKYISEVKSNVFFSLPSDHLNYEIYALDVFLRKSSRIFLLKSRESTFSCLNLYSEVVENFKSYFSLNTDRVRSEILKEISDFERSGEGTENFFLNRKLRSSSKNLHSIEIKSLNLSALINDFRKNFSLKNLKIFSNQNSTMSLFSLVSLFFEVFFLNYSHDNNYQSLTFKFDSTTDQDFLVQRLSNLRGMFFYQYSPSKLEVNNIFSKKEFFLNNFLRKFNGSSIEVFTSLLPFILERPFVIKSQFFNFLSEKVLSKDQEASDFRGNYLQSSIIKLFGEQVWEAIIQNPSIFQNLQNFQCIFLVPINDLVVLYLLQSVVHFAKLNLMFEINDSVDWNLKFTVLSSESQESFSSFYCNLENLKEQILKIDRTVFKEASRDFSSLISSSNLKDFKTNFDNSSFSISQFLNRCYLENSTVADCLYSQLRSFFENDDKIYNLILINSLKWKERSFEEFSPIFNKEVFCLARILDSSLLRIEDQQSELTFGCRVQEILKNLIFI